tara:strand:+ start:1150 stop:2727 length:1578 start_codon:yes stop_codon:yes gene_type:complete
MSADDQAVRAGNETNFAEILSSLSKETIAAIEKTQVECLAPSGYKGRTVLGVPVDTFVERHGYELYGQLVKPDPKHLDSGPAEIVGYNPDEAMSNYWTPENSLKHLRETMGYMSKQGCYCPEWSKPLEMPVHSLRLDGCGVTTADLQALSERIVFTGLERLSLLNNTFEQPKRAAKYLKTIREKHPKLRVFLVPIELHRAGAKMSRQDRLLARRREFCSPAQESAMQSDDQQKEEMIQKIDEELADMTPEEKDEVFRRMREEFGMEPERFRPAFPGLGEDEAWASLEQSVEEKLDAAAATAEKLLGEARDLRVAKSVAEEEAALINHAVSQHQERVGKASLTSKLKDEERMGEMAEIIGVADAWRLCERIVARNPSYSFEGRDVTRACRALADHVTQLQRDAVFLSNGASGVGKVSAMRSQSVWRAARRRAIQQGRVIDPSKRAVVANPHPPARADSESAEGSCSYVDMDALIADCATIPTPPLRQSSLHGELVSGVEEARQVAARRRATVVSGVEEAVAAMRAA